MGRARWLFVLGSLWLSAGWAAAQDLALPEGSVECGNAEPPRCAIDCNDPCGLRAWFSAEYLLWSVDDAPLPVPLVTVGSLADRVPGALGQPNTRVLFGGDDADFGAFSGGRFSGGVWLQPELGFEASGFVLERRSTGFSARSDAGGNPLLGRPFFNPLENAENNLINSVPGRVVGGTEATSSLRLWGWEASMATRHSPSGNVFFGYRTLDLRESLRLSDTVVPLLDETLTFQGAFVDAGSVISDFDSFSTHNRFHGFQVGGRHEWSMGRLSIGVLGKLGLGWTRQTVTVDGASTLVEPGGATTTAPGGLLAQTTNIGRRSDSEFAVVPEAGISAGFQLTPRLRARVGYTFLYWSSVVRPGEQIDRVVNPRLIPTAQDSTSPAGEPARPGVRSQQSDFWAHGVDFGIEFRY